MARGLPASVAIVCGLWVVPGVARADDPPPVVRRPVAIIALSEDLAAQDFGEAVFGQLAGHWALEPLETRAFDAALTGAFVDEDRAQIARASELQRQAQDALAQFDLNAQFDLKKVRDAATEGQQALASVTPTPTVVALFAELAFEVGQAQLGLGDAAKAAAAFALAHHLDPGKQASEALYLPPVVIAFDKAKAASAAPVKLEIAGTGHVWIDGVERADAPATVDVAPGPHWVVVTGPDRRAIGELTKAPGKLEIADAPLDDGLKIKRARLALARAPQEAVARAGLMNQLAELLHVHDAVLISTRDGKLMVQTWQDKAPGFSALREHAPSEPPIEVLSPLAPAKPPEPAHDPTVKPLPFVAPPHVEDEPPWYRKRWVQASVAGGVIVTVVGAILWARQTHYIDFGNGDIKTGGM